MREREAAKIRAKYARELEPFGEPVWDGSAYGRFAYIEREVGPFVVRLSIGDDSPVDWGDCEPTEAERDASSSYFVAVEVLEDGEEVHGDSIGGCDAIDLPGYVQRDWEDIAAYAWVEYLRDDAMAYVEREPVERAYWASRDVETVA